VDPWFVVYPARERLRLRVFAFLMVGAVRAPFACGLLGSQITSSFAAFDVLVGKFATASRHPFAGNHVLVVDPSSGFVAALRGELNAVST
jgi:hypothetical protein